MTTLPYTVRPLQRADLPALHAMLVAVGQADDLPLRETLADMETQFDDPWSDAARDAVVAMTAAGQLAAFGRSFMNPTPTETVRVFYDTVVHPAHRADGLEDRLLDWAETRGNERLTAAPAHLPRAMRHHCQDTQHAFIARLEARGYTPVRYFYRMRRDLRDPIPAGALPAGLTLRVYTPDMSQAMMNALNESFRDHWSFEPVSAEDWEMFFIQRQAFRPDLSFLVMDGGEVAAFCYNTVGAEENARSGVNEGWVGDLGTRRPWRKRGLATALLCASMRAFKAEGLDYATLGVDSQNPTGALGVYERVGFKPVKRFIAFEKAVHGG